MQLHALETELTDAVQLGDRAVTLQGVDAAEPGERLRMVTARLRYKLVGHARAAGGGFRGPGEQQGQDGEVLVVAREFVERSASDLGAEVRLCRFHIPLHRYIEPLRSGQVNMEIDRSQREPDDSWRAGDAVGAGGRLEPPHGPAQSLARGGGDDAAPLDGGTPRACVLRGGGLVRRTRTAAADRPLPAPLPSQGAGGAPGWWR